MRRAHILVSFASDRRGSLINALMDTCKETGIELDLFIDSGAYTANKSGNPIVIEDYAEFLLQYREVASHYCNLDVIGDYRESSKNQRLLEDAGLSPVPVFHYGSPMEVLREMLPAYPNKLSLGGLVGKSRRFRDIFLRACSEVIIENMGENGSHIHLFGMSPAAEFLEIHPWESFDSSAGAACRWGNVSLVEGSVRMSYFDNHYRKSKAVISSISQNARLSRETIDGLIDAITPSRGPNSVQFWNTISSLGTVARAYRLFSKNRLPTEQKFYNVCIPWVNGVRPYLDLLLMGLGDIYENYRNTRQPAVV